MLQLIFKSKVKIFRFALTLAVIVMAGCAEQKPPAYQGYVEGEFIYVSSSEAGHLDRLLVARGQQVPAKAPLFVLESESEAAAQRQAQQQLSAAEAQLKDIKKGKRRKELDVIRAQLAQAVAQDRKSVAKRVRDELQYQTGGISKAQMDETYAEAEANAARVRELKSQLNVANLPAREEQIKAQSANVSAARAVLDQATWRLNQKAVTASRPGLIFDTFYWEGEWIKAGSPVICMLPPENIKVRFFVPETLVGSLSIGRPVVLHCDGCPSDIPAKVTYISTESEYTPPVIYSNETRSKLVFMIEARPSESNAKTPVLHPGQPIEVRLK
ncbi:MAG: HlyD family efflux transporter periplasmic adaptor subunit [Syntrophales bacterium]